MRNQQSIEDYIFTTNNSLIKFKKPSKFSPNFTKSDFSKDPKFLNMDKLESNNSKMTQISFQEEAYIHKLTKNKILIKTLDKKFIQYQKKQQQDQQLSKQIQAKLKNKFIFINRQQRVQSINLNRVPQNKFFANNKNHKMKLQSLIAVNYHHLQKQRAKLYQQQLLIRSNICTMSEPRRKKNKKSENIIIIQQKKQDEKETMSTKKQGQLKNNPIKYFRLTKPIITTKKQDKNQIQFGYNEKSKILKFQQTEQSIRFIKNYEADQINIEHKILKDFSIKDQIFGQAFTIVHNKNSQYKILYQHNSKIRSEIASLTKTMTCLLILLICEKFNINLKNMYAKINEKAAKLKGTTAKLEYADIVCVHDLLYGLMLPSGNDAALALAQWGGKCIRMHCNNKIDSISPKRKGKNTKLISDQPTKKSHISLFIYHMNLIARELNLLNTRFSNVHGLMNKKNYSCSDDIMKLCLFAMRRKDFSQIVNTKQYKCIIRNKKFASERAIIWINTNKLLKIDRFCGIKTGITPSAGPCLASSFKIAQQQYIYIVLLKTKSVNYRFEESKKLTIQIIKLLYAKSNKRIYLNALQAMGTNIDITDDKQDDNNFQPTEQQQNQPQSQMI